jgi:urease accessory protein
LAACSVPAGFPSPGSRSGSRFQPSSSAVVVGAFAIFHGHAHGAELPESANAISYSAGFVIATGSLHALGILIGVANRWRLGARLLRAGGALISLGGLYFLVGHFVGG